MVKQKTEQKTAAELLAAKREELGQAEAALAAAEAAMHTKGVASAQIEIDALKGFIQRLEADHRREVEAYWRGEAERLVAERAARYREGVGELDAEAQRVRKVIAEALAECAAVYGKYAEVGRLFREVEVLALRYPDLENGTSIAFPPPPPSIAVEIFEHDQAGAARQVRPLPVTRRASDTPDERARAGYQALEKFLKGSAAKNLSAEVRAVLDAVGVPEWQTEEEKARAEEHKARIDAQAKVNAQAIDEALPYVADDSSGLHRGAAAGEGGAKGTGGPRAGCGGGPTRSRFRSGPGGQARGEDREGAPDGRGRAAGVKGDRAPARSNPRNVQRSPEYSRLARGTSRVQQRALAKAFSNDSCRLASSRHDNGPPRTSSLARS